MNQQSVPLLKYIAIVKGEKISESQEAFRKQVVYFLCLEDDQPSEDEQLRTMGLVLGTIQFCDQFSNDEGDEYMHLDTDVSRTVVLKLESIYWFICTLSLAKSPEGASFNSITLPQHIANTISLGYKAFLLHHGTFDGCDSSEMAGYWKIWARKFPAYLSSNGSGSLSHFTSRSFVKKSFLPVDLRTPPYNQAVDFCISDVSLGDRYGMLQMTSENIERDSIADLLNYAHSLDSGHEIETADQNITEPEARSNLASYMNVARTLEVFDPFSNALDTVSHYFWPRAPSPSTGDEGNRTAEGKFLTKSMRVYLKTRKGSFSQFTVALYKIGDILFTLVLEQEPCGDELQQNLDDYCRSFLASRPSSHPLNFHYVLAATTQKVFYSSLPMMGDLGICPSQQIHSMVYNLLLERRNFDTTEIVTKQQKNLWAYHKIMPDKQLIVIKKFKSDDSQKSKVFFDTKGDSDQVVLSLGDDVADWFESITELLKN